MTRPPLPAHPKSTSQSCLGEVKRGKGSHTDLPVRGAEDALFFLCARIYYIVLCLLRSKKVFPELVSAPAKWGTLGPPEIPKDVAKPSPKSPGTHGYPTPLEPRSRPSIPIHELAHRFNRRLLDSSRAFNRTAASRSLSSLATSTSTPRV